jgi:hypothetical protein
LTNPDSKALSITMSKATAKADYDLTLNEANFYKFFVMGKNDINANAQVAVFLKYWDGAQWVLSKETPSNNPILLTWSQKDDTITQQNFQVKLNSSSRWYTFEMQWRSGNVQISKFTIMPSPNLDNEPQTPPSKSMGSKDSSRSRDGSSSTLGPMESRPVNATYQSKLIPQWLMTAMYEKLGVPLIGQTIPFQGPQFNTSFGKYVAFDLNWFIEIDQLGEKSAWVQMTLHGEIELEGSGIKLTYALEAKVDWSRDRPGSFWDQMNWSITFSIGAQIPVGRMMWGFPIDTTVKTRSFGIIFRLQFDIWWEINIQLQVTGDFQSSDHIMWVVRFYTQIYAKFNMDLVLDLNSLVSGLKTNQKAFEAETNQLEEEKARASDDFDKAVEKRTKWLKENHDKYGTYNNAFAAYGTTPDTADDARKLQIAEDRYNDINQRYVAATKKNNESKDYILKFVPFVWVKLPSFHLACYAILGVAIGFSLQIPMDRSYVRMLTYMEFMFKFEFFIKFTFKFLFWKFKLIIIDFWVVIDKIVWYNKIHISGNDPNFDNDGFWGKIGWWDREDLHYNDPDAYNLLFKWSENEEYSNWGIKFLVFSKA